MMTNLAEKIQEKIVRLPEPLVQEVLAFIGHLEHRHGLWAEYGEGCLMVAQEDVMRHIWDNAEDEVWNDVPIL
ncbi:MAG: hypothetical protein HQL81_16710 [Magnetococcales bacterium]|nr:hypothetical protein [Magnetococcales bacterium]